MIAQLIQEAPAAAAELARRFGSVEAAVAAGYPIKMLLASINAYRKYTQTRYI
jgi:hypothetical protein